MNLWIFTQIWNMMHVRDLSLLELVSPAYCPGDKWFAMVPFLAGACGTNFPATQGSGWGPRPGSPRDLPDFR